MRIRPKGERDAGQDVKIFEVVGVSEDSIQQVVHNGRAYPSLRATCAVFGIEGGARRYLLR
jgi:hypothetical protein